eukprot:2707099-Amphidinium_carterae.1
MKRRVHIHARIGSCSSFQVFLDCLCIVAHLVSCLTCRSSPGLHLRHGDPGPMVNAKIVEGCS